ncbi:MAG: hypothetical protein WBD20_07335 [Pirellulaceae bacterium]
MRAIVEKFGPPTVVLGTALYLGMPPAAPLDLGESPVRAAAVRWKADELEPPVIARAAVNPFGQVLVATAEMEVEPDTGKLVVATKPTGPSPDAMKSGLTLTGIAGMGGRKWAIINGKPQLSGDSIKAIGPDRLICEVVSIHADHVVVACEETIVQLRPNNFQSKPTTPAITTVSNPSVTATKTVTDTIAPPPTALAPTDDLNIAPSNAPPQA